MPDTEIISKSILFKGLQENEVKDTLHCLGGEEKHYQKEEIIYHIGNKINKMGLVLSGSVNIVRLDVWGNQNILEHIEHSEVFAEVYACAPDEPLMVEVEAAEDANILFLDIGKIMTTCTSACRQHSRLIQNLLQVMATKNLGLTRKMNYLAQKSIRERLLAYLSYQSVYQDSLEFEIPFNRQQLADYLAVDRSALSGELSKMKKAGLIDYRKSHFTLFADN